MLNGVAASTLLCVDRTPWSGVDAAYKLRARLAAEDRTLDAVGFWWYSETP